MTVQHGRQQRGGEQLAGIGASLHEPPFLDSVDQTVLQAGMTFTVEPSIRIPGKYANRVEDVAVVGITGASLFNVAPHDLVMVE